MNRRMSRRALAALGVAMVAASTADASSTSELLAAVAANARFPTATRADVKIDRTQDGKTTTTAAVLIGRGQTLLVATADGFRALVRPSKIVVRAGRRIRRATPGLRLAGSDLLLEDLTPVTPAFMKMAQVSDDGPTGIVVTGAPAFPSARALIVLTVDPENHAVTRIKYYEKSISDLAAFRRDEDHVDVAGHARPTRITVERSRDGSTTALTLAWHPDPEATPSSFGLGALRMPLMPAGSGR
jgi:hypothetical protein